MIKLRTGAAALAAFVALTGSLVSGWGQAQQTGGGVGETIKVPISQPALPAATLPTLPTTPGFEKLPGINQAAGIARPGISGTTKDIEEFLTQDFNAPDPNGDIAINPSCGQGAICVQWYSGKDAAKMARAMAFELHNNPAYKLSAFTFRYGIEECKAEQKKILDNIKEQQERYSKANLVPDSYRIPRARPEVQYAVLVGGYKDMDAAGRDLARLKKLPPPDPKKVSLHMQYILPADERGKPLDGQYAAINPFIKALVVRNPSVMQQAKGNSAEDMTIWKNLNSEESYSLLKCKKPFTLRVKQYGTPAVLQDKKSPPSILERLGLTSSSDRPDTAAINAHNLAELLFKSGKLEVYVLHSKYCSYVTFGSYDSPEDGRIARDQQFLLQLNQKLQLNSTAQLAPPQLMEVPK